ncbi:hypothetical protein E2C01_046603 [Portunus trituberculatus]|uniref:Uncharacterized protein n=1 Tax=Portunus trituberculatus TaxID=210409 RepID=A0A5B7G592_PORTR|nr:hypothetical protein [Portunus trituberculatus]
MLEGKLGSTPRLLKSRQECLPFHCGSNKGQTDAAPDTGKSQPSTSQPIDVSRWFYNTESTSMTSGRMHLPRQSRHLNHSFT